MQVLITGGTGAVGVAVVEQCVARGWSVRVIGRRPGFDIPGAEYAVCDVLDYDNLRHQIHGCDTVVHLAAIPNPRVANGREVFQTNVAGTQNVFEAAAAQGIRHLVQAGSINAFGCFWGNTDISLQYLPIDEAHPTYTTDAYSFSKEVIEAMGDYYWRREGISSLALRLPAVWPSSRVTSEEFQARQAEVRGHMDQLAAMPEAERSSRLARLRESGQDFRRRRMMEYPAAQNGIQRDEDSADPLWPVYVFDRLNFWAYVDERDSAQAIVKAVEAGHQGSHVLFINAANNWVNYPAQELARLFFPETDDWRGATAGVESLVSIAKARDLIGYAPDYATVPGSAESQQAPWPP